MTLPELLGLQALAPGLPAAGACAAGAAKWAQCGGLGSAPSPAEAADAPWTSVACPSGCACKRVTAYYYQCTPTRPPPHDAGRDARLCASQHLCGEQERACFLKM